MTKISLHQDIIFLTSFPKFEVSTLQNHGNTALYNFVVFIWVVQFIIFFLFFIIRLNFTKHISETVRHKKLEHASKCLIRWSPVHCHYDKRSKGIISAIGSLEKPLILPNFAKIGTFKFRDYSTFRHTSWYHFIRFIVSSLTVTLA